MRRLPKVLSRSGGKGYTWAQYLDLFEDVGFLLSELGYEDLQSCQYGHDYCAAWSRGPCSKEVYVELYADEDPSYPTPSDTPDLGPAPWEVER